MPVLLVAVVAVSVSSIFIRLADAPGPVIAAYRLAIAAVLFLPIGVRGLRNSRVTGRGLMLSALSGVMLAGHFATWITSLEHTSVAASVALVTTNPLWLVLISWMITRRFPGRRIMTGVLVAVSGGILIGVDGAGGGEAGASGNMLALAGAVLVSVYMLMTRAAQKSGLSVAAHAGISYMTAAIVLAPLPLMLGLPYQPYTADTYFWIVLLAIIPQLVGHTGINYALNSLDPALVSTLILLEPVIAGLLALFLFGEVPGLLTVAGALVLLAGVMIVNRPARLARVTA